jgi:cell division transport system permease protein
MGTVSHKISQIDGVFEVKYVKNLVSAVTQNLSRFLLVLALLSALLISTAVLIINNTIRLALHSQRMLIRSMQLVGADPWFIQRPFVMRSILQGIYAALLAGAVLVGLYQWLYHSVPGFDVIYSPSTLAAIIFALACVGAIIGGLSSLFSVRRLLRLSLDQLY